MVLDVIINKLNLAKSSAQGMLVTLVRLEIINKTEQGFYKWD
jgi:DNA-binding IclR family transcriptional regulator